MKLQVREPQDDDQERVQQAIVLFGSLAEEHPEICPNIWVSAFMRMIAHSLKHEEASLEDFKHLVTEFFDNYKGMFE